MGFLFAVVSSVFVCSCILWSIHLISATRRGRQRRYRDLQTCEIITSGRIKTPELRGIYGPLEARAKPNQRLVRAFSIDSTFTTTDPAYSQQFNRDAALSITKGDEQWRSYTTTVLEIVHSLAITAIDVTDQAKGLLLVPLVQSLVLKFAILVLFDVQPRTLNDSTIAVIADKINVLWVESKRSCSAPDISKDQEELVSALQETLPYDKDNARENPPNLILPAYETMWRIVLRCFLEARFRSGRASSGFSRLFNSFLKEPTLSVLKKIPEDCEVCVEHIVNEALRLYSPTRRIYRQVDADSSVAADIEFLHRDRKFWGEDSLSFKPTRWLSVSEDALKAFMPFGGPRRFTCPSKGNSGPRMIGLLVAALLAEFSEEWGLRAERPEDEIMSDGPLNLDRHGYSTLRLMNQRPTVAETTD